MDSSLEFDAYPLRIQCVIALVVLFSLTEKVTLVEGESPSLLNWDQFLQKVRGLEAQATTNLRMELTPNEADRKRGKFAKLPRMRANEGNKTRTRSLAEYFFKPGRGLVALYEQNKETSAAKIVERIAHLIALLASEVFLAEDKPLVRERNNNSRSDIANLIGELSRFTDVGHVTQALKAIENEASMEGFISRNFESSMKINHPYFPSLKIGDARTIKAEFHGLYNEPNESPDRNAGLFLLVHEPRGLFSAVPPDDGRPVPHIRSQLVRDALFILPKKERLKHGKFCGFYINARDNARETTEIAMIEEVDEDEGTIFVHGQLPKSSAVKQKFSLVFSSLSQREYSAGIISGMASRQIEETSPSRASGGAWKAILVRPSRMLPAWKSLTALETVLFQCKADDLIDVQSLVAKVGALGILYSEEREDAKLLEQRWTVFRQIVGNDQRFGFDTAQAFGKFLSGCDKFQKEAEKARSKKDIIKLFTECLKEHWHLWEPAQIVNLIRSDKLTITKSEIESLMGTAFPFRGIQET